MFIILTSLNFKLVTNYRNNMVKVPYMVLPCFTCKSVWWESLFHTRNQVIDMTKSKTAVHKLFCDCTIRNFRHYIAQ